jgi:hypothetical protein
MEVPGPRPASDPLPRLEAKVRWLTALCTFLSLGFLALVAWQLVPRTTVVEAHAFVVRDAQWRRRAVLGLGHDGAPMLTLNSRAERSRFMVLARDGGETVIRLTDSADVQRARLVLEPDGKPALLLSGPDGRPRVAIAPVGEGLSGIRLLGPDLKTAWRAP